MSFLYVIPPVYDACFHSPYLVARTAVHLQHSTQRRVHIAKLFMTMLERSRIPSGLMTRSEARDRMSIHALYYSDELSTTRSSWERMYSTSYYRPGPHVHDIKQQFASLSDWGTGHCRVVTLT